MIFAAPTPAQLRDAQELTGQSIAEYEIGDFVAACRDAGRAYLLSRKPALLFNLGQCHRAQRHYAQAAFSYRSYLHALPTAPNRVEVQKLIQEMEAKAASEPAREAPASSVTEPLPPTMPSTPAPAPVAPTPPVPAPALAASPPASIHATAASPSHALPLSLLAIAAAATGVAVYSAVQVGRFEGFRAGLIAMPAGSATPVTWGQAQALQTSASDFQWAAILGGVAAAGGIAGGILTW
ncbi:MAG: hypothetical protein ACYCWW_11275 [Deltaproteobacteria bacterium]